MKRQRKDGVLNYGVELQFALWQFRRRWPCTPARRLLQARLHPRKLSNDPLRGAHGEDQRAGGQLNCMITV